MEWVFCALEFSPSRHTESTLAAAPHREGPGGGVAVAVASLLDWGLSPAYTQRPGGRTGRAQWVRRTQGERGRGIWDRTDLGGVNKSGVVGPSGSGGND